MEELSIKIKIAERMYPMKIHQQDEERMREAGKLINERIAVYASQFGIQDKQDLLAMVAFDCLMESLQKDDEGEEVLVQQAVCRMLRNIDRVLEA